MSDHEIVWTFDAPGVVRATATCKAPSGASCRNMPKCDCEEWDEEQRDEQGWFHVVDPWGSRDIHRHTRPVDCNICTWLNESDILECTEGFNLDIAVTPIRPIWVGSGYDWEPA